jgi:hypothetical protein
MPQHNTMNSHGNVEVEIHVFLTAVLDEGEWLYSPSDSSFFLSLSLCLSCDWRLGVPEKGSQVLKAKKRALINIEVAGMRVGLEKNFNLQRNEKTEEFINIIKG